MYVDSDNDSIIEYSPMKENNTLTLRIHQISFEKLDNLDEKGPHKIASIKDRIHLALKLNSDQFKV